MAGEVVVEEELAAHEVEGEVVGGPAEEEEAGAVVEAGSSTCPEFRLAVLSFVGGEKNAYVHPSCRYPVAARAGLRQLYRRRRLRGCSLSTNPLDCLGSRFVASYHSESRN